jgi:O-antigen/teichoic acid export membrane protein
MIADVFKKTGKHSLVYGAGSIAGRAVGFVMIPFYTHFLRPADYGVLELLDLTTFFLGTIVGLGLTSAIVRFFYDYQDEDERHEVVSTALLFGIVLLGVVYLLLCPLSRTFSDSLFGTAEYGFYFRIVFASLCFDTVAELALAHVRARQLSVRATVFTLARLVMSLTFNVYFIAGLRLGVLGVLYSGLISSCTIAVVLTSTTLREVGSRFSRAKLAAMVRYGFPLIPMSLGMFVLNFSDRFFLQRFANLSEVGIYSLGYKLGMANGVLITSPFLLFWGPYALEIIQRPDGRELVARMQVYFTCVLLACTLAIAMIGDPLVRVLSPPEYHRAASVIPIVGLAYLFLGLSYFFRIGLSYTKRTKYMGFAVGGVALLNLPLNFMLIPRFYAMGAAWATLLSFAALALALFLTSQSVYAIPYEYRRMIKLLAAGAIVFAVSKLLPVASLIPALLVNGTCLLTLPLLLHGLRFFDNEELDHARAFARTLMGRVRPASGAL